MTLYKTLFNDEKFYNFLEFFDTISEKRNYFNAHKAFNIDKSTINSWHKINSEENPDKSYKKLIAEFLLNHSKEKTREFEKKYQVSKEPEDLVNDRIISIMFDIPFEDLEGFKVSSKDWKYQLIEYFKTLNKDIFIAQINTLRYRLNKPTISPEYIKSLENV